MKGGKAKGKGKRRTEFPWGTERDYPFRIILVKVVNWQENVEVQAAEEDYHNENVPHMPRFPDPEQRRSPEQRPRPSRLLLVSRA